MSASFEYTLFQMGEEPSSEDISQMLVRFCMMDRVDKSVISGLVRALHALRQEEAESEDDEAEVPVVEDPEGEFRRQFKAACEQEGHYYDEEQPNWEDHWPLDCPWHEQELARLARLQVGWGEVFRRQCREMMKKGQ